jgi:hypothetical protein
MDLLGYGLRAGVAQMAVVPFNPYIVHARRAAREAQALAVAAREQARQRARLPETPPPPPKLRVNLSPPAAIRTLCLFGLGVAVCATVAATLTMISSHAGAGADLRLTPSALGRLTAWLASLPWLFLGLTLFAVASIERLVARADAWVWTGLSVAAVVLAASQALGGIIVDVAPPLVRVGVLVTLLGVTGFVLREFFSTESGAIRLQIAGGVTGGFAVAIAPFTLLGQAVLPETERTTTLAALLSGCDALLGLVVATLTVHATLVYVRDFLPDFTIALDTADASEPRVSAGRARN